MINVEALQTIAYVTNELRKAHESVVGLTQHVQKMQAETAEVTADIKENGAAMRKELAAANAEIQELRHQLAVAKVPPTEAALMEEIERLNALVADYAKKISDEDMRTDEVELQRSELLKKRDALLATQSALIADLRAGTDDTPAGDAS